MDTYPMKPFILQKKWTQYSLYAMYGVDFWSYGKEPETIFHEAVYSDMLYDRLISIL